MRSTTTSHKSCGCIVRLLLFSLLVSSLAACRDSRQVTLTISAAASLQNALSEVETSYQSSHPKAVFRNNLGSSGTLAREIEQGAPVDVLISAAAKPMDDLQAKGLIDAGTRLNLLRNSLVLIAPLGSKLKGFTDLSDPSIKLIAVGDPASVPAGAYAQQTMLALHIYDNLKSRLVLGKDVRQVLTYVETGNADAGFVYATDAQTSGRVQVVAVAPDSSHEPIIYPAAVMQSSANQETARSFVQFLRSAQAKAIFAKRGFTLASD